MNRFEAWLATIDFGVTVNEFPQGTRTATDAARAVGCELGQIVKSLVFMAGARPVIALVSGPNRLDEVRLEAIAGGPVAKADAETARLATGYSTGGVPPFGHATDPPVALARPLPSDQCNRGPDRPADRPSRGPHRAAHQRARTQRPRGGGALAP